jgi:hypothetical protein
VTRTITAGDRYASDLAGLRTDRWAYEIFAPDEDRAKQRSELKEWFKKQAELIHAGKPTALRAVEPLYFSRWQVDAP